MQAGLLLSFHRGQEPGFPAAALLLPSFSCPLFPTLREVYSISPGRFSHFFLPVSKQALGEHHRSVTTCLQGERFHFSSLLVPRSTGTGRGRTTVEGEARLAAQFSLSDVLVW